MSHGVWIVPGLALLALLTMALITSGEAQAPAQDIFQTSQQAYALSRFPSAGAGARTWVFVNGLLMLAGTDYTISGNVLTFTGQTIGDTPVIQVQYW